MLRPSDWFTAVRVQRLAQALRLIPGQPPGIAAANVNTVVWEACGGPFDETADLIQVLKGLALITQTSDALIRTRAGGQVAKAIAKGDMKAFGLVLMRAGYLHDQARSILEQGDFQPDGSLICSRRLAAAAAPQLLGVLAWWETVDRYPLIRIPSDLLAELNTVWALLPPVPEIPEGLTERKAIGDRAEMYTVQFEKTRCGDPSKIAWVARDSDSLGWDVEDRTRLPIRCIEVKGRRDTKQAFFLSDNELGKLRALGTAYQIQFWGNIDLTREPAVEYAALRAVGYPVLIDDFLDLVGSGEWSLTPVRWRAERNEL